MIDFKELVIKKLTHDAESISRSREGINVFHPSQVSGCLRSAFLNKLHATTFSVDILGKMCSGTSIHQYIQSWPEIKEAFDIEVPIEYHLEGVEGIYIKGHADLVAKDKSMLGDIKSSASLDFVRSRPSSHHVEQVNLYLKALGIQEGEILYIAKLNFEPLVHKITYDEEMFQRTISKIKMVYRLLKLWNEKKSVELIPKKCSSDCFMCRGEQLTEEFKKEIASLGGV